jgi:hypothetical protein
MPEVVDKDTATDTNDLNQDDPNLDDGAGDGSDGDGSDGSDTGKKGDDKTLTMTQDKLNTLLAKNRRSLTKQNEVLAKKLETLQTQVNMTDAEREGLSETIASLRDQTKTASELKRQELKKKEEEFSKRYDTVKGERDGWKTKFANAEINRSLMDAASKFKAYDAEQLVGILSSKTRLVEAVDDVGAPTGKFSVVVDYASQDEDGKDITLVLSPQETVKAMSETERHANLFVARGAPGLGQKGNDAKADDKPPTHDMKAYMAWRKSQK